VKVITYGEIMLRLKPPGYERFMQTPFFEASFGGGEANVAVSLAQFDIHSAFVSVLPCNDIAKACVMELRKFGVDTSHIQYGDGRMGIYFLEGGANQRPSKVIYDRDGSCMARVLPDQIDWESVLAGADWLHITGITPAISENSAAVSLKAVKTAKKLGLTVSCDLNYRSKLWNYGKSAPEVMGEIARFTDICIANEEDIQSSLGINAETAFGQGELDIDKYHHLSKSLMQAYPNIKLAAITLRESMSANENSWSACLFDGNRFIRSKKYEINDIVDRVGGGDSFAAGFIFGLNKYEDPQHALEFAAAASCLKHSIKGDFNRISETEVEALMGGESSGRIKR